MVYITILSELDCPNEPHHEELLAQQKHERLLPQIERLISQVVIVCLHYALYCLVAEFFTGLLESWVDTQVVVARVIQLE